MQYAQQFEEQSCLIWVYRMLDSMRISLVWVYSKWLSLDLVYSMLCNINMQPGLALHYVRQYEEQTGLGLPYALLYRSHAD